MIICWLAAGVETHELMLSVPYAPPFRLACLGLLAASVISRTDLQQSETPNILLIIFHFTKLSSDSGSQSSSNSRPAPFHEI